MMMAAVLDQRMKRCPHQATTSHSTTNKREEHVWSDGQKNQSSNTRNQHTVTAAADSESFESLKKEVKKQQ